MKELEAYFERRLNKKDSQELAKTIVQSPELLEKLWLKIKNGSPGLPFHIAWLFEICVFERPEAALLYLEEIIETLPKPFHNGVHRSLSKILTQYPIPEIHQGPLYSLCIDWLLSPNKHVAIKVHCMEIAFGIAATIPELLEELEIVINDQLEFNTVAFAARGKKILKKIKKISSI